MLRIRLRKTDIYDRQSLSAEAWTSWPKMLPRAVTSAHTRSAKMLETPGRIEPCFFEEHIPARLADQSVEIQREAWLAVLYQALARGIDDEEAGRAKPLADVVARLERKFEGAGQPAE